MFFQTRKKRLGAQKFILKIINNNSPELIAAHGGPRGDKRVNLSIVVLVVPLVKGKLQINNAFHTVTKELSVNGVGIILDQQMGLNEVILGFSLDGSMTFLHAKAKHLTSMGGSMYHLGLEIDELVPISQYPELEAFEF